MLHPRYFDRLLHASNGGNLSLIRQISSLLHVLRVLCGFKFLFLSPPILVRLVPGMDLVRVSNFKRGPELLDGFLCDLNCWNLPLHDHRGVHHLVGGLRLRYLYSLLHLLDDGHQEARVLGQVVVGPAWYTVGLEVLQALAPHVRDHVMHSFGLGFSGIH